MGGDIYKHARRVGHAGPASGHIRMGIGRYPPPTDNGTTLPTTCSPCPQHAPPRVTQHVSRAAMHNIRHTQIPPHPSGAGGRAKQIVRPGRQASARSAQDVLTCDASERLRVRETLTSQSPECMRDVRACIIASSCVHHVCVAAGCDVCSLSPSLRYTAIAALLPSASASVALSQWVVYGWRYI